MKLPQINIEHTSDGFRTVAIFATGPNGNVFAISSPVHHTRMADAILEQSRDIDRIIVDLHGILHDAGDEYIRNKWDELNRPDRDIRAEPIIITAHNLKEE
jgi:hypothetical protein